MDFFQAGRTFLWSGHGVPQRHLWIVLTDPDPTANQVIVVMVVSRKPYSDATVILQPGDHPFIEHESCVDFSTGRTVSVSRLEAHLADDGCSPRPDVGKGLLRRIQKGLLESEYTDHYLKPILQARLANPSPRR